MARRATVTDPQRPWDRPPPAPCYDASHVEFMMRYHRDSEQLLRRKLAAASKRIRELESEVLRLGGELDRTRRAFRA